MQAAETAMDPRLLTAPGLRARPAHASAGHAGGVWLALIGWFLVQAATAEGRQASAAPA
jgi:hypothetical protein